ncbi:hypothetical protein [Pseudosulfitobacter sp. SM2401]|uniref:hypothetical protein n=1 Tax=Pseudosulfitobacter sp. SM2401 TaxID=3350098 RepID=UPI0036F23A9B
MAKISDEVQVNYKGLAESTKAKLTANLLSLEGKKPLLESYARLAALNGIKLDLIKDKWSEPAAHFFDEAHNDALLSHFNASFGSWRPALQSLRSFFENTMAAIYYAEHPVELKKWEKGTFRMEPRELREYVVGHPLIEPIAKEKQVDLKTRLDGEYRELSSAVHGSKSIFRMTGTDGKPNLADVDLAKLGKWSARERSTVDLCVLMLVAVFNQDLDGTKRQPLRGGLAIALTPSSKKALKSHYNIRIT